MTNEQIQHKKSNLVFFDLEGFKRSPKNTINTKIIGENSLPKNYIVSEIASILRCKSDTVYKMIKKREIPYNKIKGRVLFEASKFHEWYDKFYYQTVDEIQKTA